MSIEFVQIEIFGGRYDGCQLNVQGAAGAELYVRLGHLEKMCGYCPSGYSQSAAVRLVRLAEGRYACAHEN